MDFHTLPPAATQGSAGATLARIGMPEQIGPRHAAAISPMSLAGRRPYSAGYYAYLWSKCWDADGFRRSRKRMIRSDPRDRARLYKIHLFRRRHAAIRHRYRAFPRPRSPCRSLAGRRGPCGARRMRDARACSTYARHAGLWRPCPRPNPPSPPLQQLPVVLMQPYDEHANADAMVAAAFDRARKSHKRVLIDLGATGVWTVWCWPISQAAGEDAALHGRALPNGVGGCRPF